jgi:membrane-associated phospholipid phosphatase
MSPARRLQPWLTAAGLVLSATVCAALVALTYYLAVRTTRGRLLDGASLRGAVEARSGLTDVVERLLDTVSVLSLLGAAALLALIGLARLRRELAVAAVVLVVGANATTQVLKRLVLDRPDAGLEESTPATLNSLPSGHSTVAFSVAVALVLVVPVRLRPVVAGVGVVYATLLALATLTSGWHRPSDSVAAFLVVACWAALVGATLVVVHAGHGADDGEGGHRPTVRRLARVAAGLLAFGALVAVVVLATGLDTYGTFAQVLAYVAGGCAVAGTGAAVMAGLLAVVPLAAPARDVAVPPPPSPAAEEATGSLPGRS